MSKCGENFYEFFLSQTDDSCQEAQSGWIEKMPQEWQFSHLFTHYNKRRRQKEGYMKSTGDKLREQEKEKWKSHWDWIKS